MYICIDIGGTAIKHGLSSASGTLLQQGSTPTRAHEGGGSGIVRTVRQLIRQYIETKQENETIDALPFHGRHGRSRKRIHLLRPACFDSRLYGN